MGQEQKNRMSTNRQKSKWGMGTLLSGLFMATLLLANGPACAAESAASEDEALHVLNRLAFGPRPGEVARVMRMGIDRYIDEQLYPGQIPMPPALSERLAQLETQKMSDAGLIAQFREDQKRVKNDPEAGRAARRALYQRLGEQSGAARLIRAIESPRELEEVMVDFWFNHFNVFQGKGLDRVLVANYEREAIRPYVLGRFRDLLGATAHHPAMLFYLDNWLSSAPGFEGRGGSAAKGRPSGLNENYAREVMELHTLGVDGGYTQKDVTELARMLTGWTFDASGRGDGSLFRFDARRHDWGQKMWLGNYVAPRGQAEGEFALDVLASSPATAHHISYELVQYFVSDAPPPALVERMAQRYLATDGDIRAVLYTLFRSPEFRDPTDQSAKFKTPYQFVVSAVRASGVEVTNVRPLLGILNQLGMPLYGCVTPDGYKNTEEAWLNPDGMSRRIGFATALAAGKIPLERAIDPQTGLPLASVDSGRSDSGSGNALEVDPLLDTLGETISDKTLKAVAETEPALRAALVLGSPDFMRR